MNLQIDELISLEEFSNYLTSGKENRKPKLIQAVNPVEFRELSETIDNALKVFENVSLSGNAGEILREIKQRQTLTRSFTTLQSLPPATRLEFCAEQMNVAVNGLITNALKYNRTGSPELDLSLVVKRSEVLLQVCNPSDRTPLSLRELAAELSNPTDYHWNFVGVNLIHLACRACKFPTPVWEEREGELVATVPVALKHNS
jgi:hypothetical protein